MNIQTHLFGSLHAEIKEGRLWQHKKMNSVERGKYRSIIMAVQAGIAGKSREVLKPKEKLWSGNIAFYLW